MKPARVCWRTALPLLVLLGWAGAAHAAPCDSLATLALPEGTRIVSATAITPPPDFVAPENALDALAGGHPATVAKPFCRVVGEAQPTPDSHINFEVWLPAQDWNGRLEGIGGSGLGGFIGYHAMATLLTRGYAVANSDLGHAGAAPGWALNHPQRIVDYAFRADHITAVAAKAAVQAFYGTPAKHAYFAGCSYGGHEALMEAERFPGDYDGIIAGAPAPDLTHLMVAFLWNWRAAMDHAGGQIPPAKLALVARAAIAACAGPAERALGFIANPDQCRFDPGTLLCQTPDAADCLTAAQVDTIWKIYAGPSNPQTGALIFPGLEPGSEAGWAPQEEGPQPLFTAFFRDFLFDDPHWDPTGFSFAHDPARLDAKLALPLNAGNPDLSAFRAHGGKLILFHGWADPLIAPMSTVHFYQQIIDAAYGDKLAETRRFARLFMIPGMGHCGGGTGPSLVDWDSAIEAWVEQGKAPDQLSAVKLAEGGQSQVVTATRPVCAWPEAARWNGTGKPTEFSSFFCAIPDRS